MNLSVQVRRLVPLWRPSLLECYSQEAKHQTRVSSSKSCYIAHIIKTTFRLWKLCELEKNKHTLHCMLWPTHCVLFVNKRGPSVYCLKGGSFAILGYILGSVHGKGNMKGTIRILNKCAQ